MKYKISDTQEINFGNIENTFFLIGLLNEFMNRFQTVGDRFFEEISWKQCFLLICIKYFKDPPSLKEVSEMMGCSHQNVKQMLIKLEKAGYVKLIPDELDKRKQRILLTQRTMEFNEKNDKPSKDFMEWMFANVDPKDLEITVKTIQQLDEQLKNMRWD